MKTRFYAILAGAFALAAMMISCSVEQEEPEVDITTIRCSIPQIDVEEDFATGILDTLFATRASFSGANFLWDEGDKIGIVPTSGAQIYFSVNDGAGTSTARFDGGDWAMKSTGTFYAYYPLYPDIFLSKDHVSVSYTGQTQNGNNNNLHTGDYWTLYTEGTKAVGNALNFSFNHLTAFFKTYVTVPAGTYTKIVFSAPSEIFIKDGYFDLGAQTPAIVGTAFTDELCLDLQNVTFTEETELTGYLVVAPVDIAGIPITITVYKDGQAAYEYTLTKTNPMVAAKTYAFRATSLSEIAPSVDQANALFAAGATSVTITEPLTEDATVVLPNTEEAVTITVPTAPCSSSLTVTVSYAQDATAYPATLSLAGPGDADLDINAPNSTVTVNGVSYNHIFSRTATNIISIDVTVNVLKVFQGDVQVYGTVKQIDLSEQEDDAIIYASGTVTTLLGEDDEEYLPATGLLLNQSSMNLPVGTSETLTASVMPLGAYPKVIWSSSDETVATVSAGGLVTAVAGGSATITAKTISGGFTASCAVTVNESSSGTSMTNYYACGVFSDHTDIYIFGDNKISDEFYSGFGTSLVKKYWLSAVAVIGENRYELAATDGFARLTTDEEEVKYGKYTWCWAFQNTTVQNALKVATIDSPVTIIMTDVNRREYALVYSKPQTSTVISTYYKYDGGMPLVSVSGVEVSPESIVLQPGDTVQLTARVLPADASDPAVSWTSSDESVATVSSSGFLIGVNGGTATITCTTNDGGFKAYCIVTVNESTSSIAVPEAIDLGLPSGLKWASFNLGATKPEEYGDYYAWGDTEPYYSRLDPLTWKEGKMAGYDWSTYSYGNDLSTLTKYVTEEGYGNNDNKTVLEADDDAATTNLGSTWRTPTDAEWTELRENCTWTWTNLNGVYGRLVTAANGNSIFLPAAGYRGGTSLIGANSQGRYWSSSLYTSYSYYAWCVDIGDVDRSSIVRCFGQSIRPVCGDSSSLIPVSGVSLNKTSMSLIVGGTETLTATVSPSNATNKSVTWSSSDVSVATVSSTGVISGIKEGVAIITARCEGVSTSCTVDVFEPIREDFNPNSYLLYRANKTVQSGYDYYEYVSELPGLSGSKVELKFQLEGPGLIGESIRVDDSCLRWTVKYKEDGEWEYNNYEHSISGSTSLIYLLFDGINHTFSVNGESISCSENKMSLGGLVTSYEHESDEGIWEVHSAEVPDNSKLYYAKAWDANGVLSYIGYATTAINPSTNMTEYCWCSYYPKTGQVSYDFANAAASLGAYEGYTYNN